MLELESVTVRHGDGTLALENLCARFTPGLWVILGPNGAGKTSLLRTAATLLRPESGRIRWNGIDALRDPGAVRWHLGYAPQHPAFPPDFTALHYLEYLAALKGVAGPHRHRRAEAVLAMVGLSHAAHVRTEHCSTGMKGRLALAQALLNDPDLLLLDEPFASLDMAERITMGALLAELAGERVVLVATHTPTDLEGTAEHLLLLARGRALFEGTALELCARAAGQVWAGTLPAEALRQVEGTILARRTGEQGEAVRILAGVQPFPGAALVNPNLDEAYIWTLTQGGETHHADSR